jgi:hypothetical protein
VICEVQIIEYTVISGPQADASGVLVLTMDLLLYFLLQLDILLVRVKDTEVATARAILLMH